MVDTRRFHLVRGGKCCRWPNTINSKYQLASWTLISRSVTLIHNLGKTLTLQCRSAGYTDVCIFYIDHIDTAHTHTHVTWILATFSFFYYYFFFLYLLDIPRVNK